MRRNSNDDSKSRLEPAAAQFDNKDVSDLIYRYEMKNDANAREILSSLQLQHRPDMRSFKNPISLDPRLNDLARIRYFQQQQHKKHYNDSIIPLTDSEYYSDDQQQDLPYKSSPKNDCNLTRFGKFIEMIARLPWPRMSVTGMGICFLVAVFLCPRAIGENLLFPAFRLLFGTLYPAYASYKAVRTKNVKEYVKWMMYWIVYAFFTCIETFTDIFLAWFPFYYEVKVIIVIWLLSPATKGSSTLYRKFVHPMLTRREQEIDEYINQAKEKGYTAVLQLGSKGVNYATNVIMQTALKGGGNLVQTIRRSYSLSDLSEPDIHRTSDEIDDIGRPQRLLRPRSQTARSASGGRNVEMYFPEVDVNEKSPAPNYNYIRSSEDISSGYSSAEPISIGLSRTASMTNAGRPRFKAKRAEEDIYLESDEYEAMPEVRHLYDYSPYAYYPINPVSTSNPQRYNPCEVEEWKNQAYLDNQQYFQENVIESLRNPKLADFDGTENTKKISRNEKSSDIEGENLKDSTEEKSENVKESSIKMTDKMADKYELFCKWLEDNEKLNNKQELDIEIPIREVSSMLPQQSEDEFVDSMSTDSENELFHETHYLDNQTQQSSSLLETILSEKLHVLSTTCPGPDERNKSESIDSIEGELALPSILDDFNGSKKSSALDSKRPAMHNKGKAPEPPIVSEIVVPGCEEEDVLFSTSCNLPETIASLNINNDPISNDDQNSRSPSPRSDSKKSSRKNLFNYLPSLFRSEPPKSNPTTDEQLKETQI